MRKMQAVFQLSLLAFGFLFAGCQPSGVSVQFAGEKSAEQYGLILSPLHDFPAEGVLRSEPWNFGGAYEAGGGLCFRVFRIENRGSVTQRLYPSIETSEGPVVGITARLWSLLPQGRVDPLEYYPPAERLTDYEAAFDAVEGEFRFESGARVPLERPRPEGEDDPERFQGPGVTVRPGESAEFRVRLRLRPGLNLIHGGLGHTGPLRMESLARIRITSEIHVGLVLRDPDSGSLVPLFLPTLGEARSGRAVESEILLPGWEAAVVPSFRELAARFRFPGLPILR